jgi:hypothetical protein
MSLLQGSKCPIFPFSWGMGHFQKAKIKSTKAKPFRKFPILPFSWGMGNLFFEILWKNLQKAVLMVSYVS